MKAGQLPELRVQVQDFSGFTPGAVQNQPLVDLGWRVALHGLTVSTWKQQSGAGSG